MTTLPEPSEQTRSDFNRARSGWRQHGIFFPLLLIAIGAIFLLTNLGYISGTGWDFIIRLWPLLLIVGGLDGLWKGEGIAGPVFWLGLGVLFLLGNFGYLGISTIEVILRYWPLLLIAIGVDILIGRRAGVIGQVLAALVAVALLAGIFWFATSGRFVMAARALESETISQPLQDATSAGTDISMAAGRLMVSGGAGADQLAQGSISLSETHRVSSSASVENGRALYQLKEDGVTVTWGDNNATRNVWDLKLSSEIPTDLRVSMGAGEALIDLTGMQIASLNAEAAVGKLVLTLPSEGGFDGHISGAIGEVVVRVPDGLAVRINTNTAIGGRNIDSGFQRDGSLVTSDGEGEPVTLSVDSAIGAIRIESVP